LNFRDKDSSTTKHSCLQPPARSIPSSTIVKVNLEDNELNTDVTQLNNDHVTDTKIHISQPNNCQETNTLAQTVNVDETGDHVTPLKNKYVNVDETGDCITPLNSVTESSSKTFSKVTSQQRKGLIPFLSSAAKVGPMVTILHEEPQEKTSLPLNEGNSSQTEVQTNSKSSISSEMLKHGIHSNINRDRKEVRSLASSKRTNDVLGKNLIDMKTETSSFLDASLNKKNKEKIKIKDSSNQTSSVKLRIDKIQLSEVRNSLFDCVRCLFDLDSYVFRSQLLSAVRTMASIATSSLDLKQVLLNSHLKYFNEESFSGWIKYIRDILWPREFSFRQPLLRLILEKNNHHQKL